MTVPKIATVSLSSAGSDAPVLVVGPSLGTSVTSLWSGVAERLGDAYAVLGWDLPGHGTGDPATGFSMAELAAGVLAAVDDHLGATATFHYAGDSLGAAVGLQLLLDAPDRIASAVLCCSGAKILEGPGWLERAEAVRRDGTEVMVESAPSRWFGTGFAERDPDTAAALLDDLGGTDNESYAAACEALAGYDLRDRLAEIATLVLTVAGAEDAVTTATVMRRLASGVQNGRSVVLDGVAHLAPAESPDRVAELIVEHTGTHLGSPRTAGQIRAEGMRVRREVLSDPYVDRSVAAATDLTAEFQDFITTYAWGGIWTRPGLDRRSRSLITLTALVARGHHEELALHLRAARRNGLTNDEIKELLLQTAIYCGVPDANTAFRIASAVLAEYDAEHEAENPAEPTKKEDD